MFRITNEKNYLGCLWLAKEQENEVNKHLEEFQLKVLKIYVLRFSPQCLRTRSNREPSETRKRDTWCCLVPADRTAPGGNHGGKIPSFFRKERVYLSSLILSSGLRKATCHRRRYHCTSRRANSSPKPELKGAEFQVWTQPLLHPLPSRGCYLIFLLLLSSPSGSQVSVFKVQT